MLKRIRFMRPRDGVAMSDYRRLWEVEHAPRLARRTGALRYIGTFFEGVEGRPPRFPHAIRIWYRDAAHLRRAYSGPRDAADPYLAVVDADDNGLMETIEYAIRPASEQGLALAWLVVPAREEQPKGALPDAWRRDVEAALADLGAHAPPVLCVVSTSTAASPGNEFVAVLELGWASRDERAKGVHRIGASDIPLFSHVDVLRVADQVPIIGAL